MVNLLLDVSLLTPRLRQRCTRGCNVAWRAGSRGFPGQFAQPTRLPLHPIGAHLPFLRASLKLRQGIFSPRVHLPAHWAFPAARRARAEQTGVHDHHRANRHPEGARIHRHRDPPPGRRGAGAGGRGPGCSLRRLGAGAVRAGKPGGRLRAAAHRVRRRRGRGESAGPGDRCGDRCPGCRSPGTGRRHRPGSRGGDVPGDGPAPNHHGLDAVAPAHLRDRGAPPDCRCPVARRPGPARTGFGLGTRLRTRGAGIPILARAAAGYTPPMFTD